MASTNLTIAAAQLICTWGWSQQNRSRLAAPKQAAARSPPKEHGAMAVERFLSAAEQIASPSSSPERADEERHLFVVQKCDGHVTRQPVGGGWWGVRTGCLGGGKDSTQKTSTFDLAY